LSQTKRFDWGNLGRRVVSATLMIPAALACIWFGDAFGGAPYLLLIAVAVFGCAMVLFAWSTHFWLSMLALAISGAADTVSVVIRMTLMQLETPDEMRGRVGAVNSIFIGASNELGEFESGAAAAWLGPVMATLIGGLGTILVAVMWLRLFPKLAQRDKLE
jgi:MFS family permease